MIPISCMIRFSGHYVPAIAAKLVSNEQSGAQGSVPTLSGIAVGDGWIDPVHMIPAYPQMMYDFGLASIKDMHTIEAYVRPTTIEWGFTFFIVDSRRVLPPAPNAGSKPHPQIQILRQFETKG